MIRILGGFIRTLGCVIRILRDFIGGRVHTGSMGFRPAHMLRVFRRTECYDALQNLWGTPKIAAEEAPGGWDPQTPR